MNVKKSDFRGPSFKMLHIMIQGIWFPVLVEIAGCPLPIHVVIRTGHIADMTENEWINKYRLLNDVDEKTELCFFDI